MPSQAEGLTYKGYVGCYVSVHHSSDMSQVVVVPPTQLEAETPIRDHHRPASQLKHNNSILFTLSLPELKTKLHFLGNISKINTQEYRTNILKIEKVSKYSFLFKLFFHKKI